MTDYNAAWLTIGLVLGLVSGVAVMVGLFALGTGWRLSRLVCSCDNLSPHFHHDGRRWFG